MTIVECEELVVEYVDWLKVNMSVACIGENACEITMPFLDRHNDHLQIYVTKREDVISLSDDGYIIADLRAAGLELNTTKRNETVQVILNGFGVKKEGSHLKSRASHSDFAQKLHFFAQAMLAMNELCVLAQPRIATFFQEGVRIFLDEAGVRYSPDVKLTGKSGFDHPIHFLVPRSRTRPERFIQTINDPNKNTVSSYLFSLNDTREARGTSSEAYVVLNDKSRSMKNGVPRDLSEALRHYGVTSIKWSERNELSSALAG